MAKQKVPFWFHPTYKTRPAQLVSFLFLWLVLAGCTPELGHEAIRLEGATMGTTYHISVIPEPDQIVNTSELQAAIDQELQQINQSMSTYIPDSELMILNRAPINEWFYVSEPLREVLEISQDISRRSSGAFDITVGPLVNLWGFGPTHRPDNKPTQEAINDAKAILGYTALEITGHQVQKLLPVQLDLSAVAKGYGVDALAQLLESRGVHRYMVEIGGELRLRGLNSKDLPWRIAIEQPEDWQGSVHKAISLTDCGMATSGDYRNYFEQNGEHYSHTIDPKTGYPITHNLASVTVIAETAAKADAWATALNVLGPEKGMAVANTEKLAVYMIVKEGDGFTDIYSEAFAVYK